MVSSTPEWASYVRPAVHSIDSEKVEMSTGTIVIIVVVVVVVLAVVALVLRPQMQRRRLQQKFGPEYDRTVESAEGRRDAERELAQREKRHAGFDLRPLSADDRERYTREWADVQERFVDAPAEAVTAADSLVTDLMAARGYPTEGYEQQLSDLSVEHSTTLEHYRSAHDITERHTRDEASTEDLRNAMVHYRSLFEDLLRDGSGDHDTDETVAAEHETSKVRADEPNVDPADETTDFGTDHDVDPATDVDGRATEEAPRGRVRRS
jgi:hypothetical protein